MPGGLRALVLDTFSFLSSASKRAGTWKTQKLLRRTQRGAKRVTFHSFGTGQVPLRCSKHLVPLRGSPHQEAHRRKEKARAALHCGPPAAFSRDSQTL